MRAVILGCGFAGLSVASALSAKSRGVEILMIDRRERFEYLPSLPEILSGKVSADEITGSLRKFATKIGAEFLQREVKSVDLKAKEVVARNPKSSSEERIPYDFLVVAVGAELAFFGIQGAEEHALSVYSLDDALKTRKRLEEAVQKEGVKCVVVGAGLTGVEVAGELVDFFSGRGCEASRVLLVEMAQRILPAFPEKVSARIERVLRSRGVEILTGNAVQSVSEREIELLALKEKAGRKIHYDILIWTAGLKPNQISADFPAEAKAKGGWLKADAFLRLKGYKDVFVAGDIAHFENGEISGKNVEEAERQGRTVAENIMRSIKGSKLRHYSPKNTVQKPRALISLGNGHAIAYFNGFLLETFAYRLKKYLERKYMRKFA